MSTTALFFVVGGFLVLNLIIGLWTGRNVKTVEEYAMGKKKWSTGALSMSIIATAIGGGFIVVSLEEIYKDGLLASIPLIGMPLSYYFRSLFFSRKQHKFLDCFSIPDIIGKVYGNSARIVTKILSIIFCILITSMQVKILSTVFATLLNVDPFYSVLFSGLVVAIYTSFGGMRAVISTDILQFIMIFGLLFVLSTFLLVKSGGFEALSSGFVSAKNLCFNSIWVYTSICLLDVFFMQESSIDPPKVERLQMAARAGKLKSVLRTSAFMTTIAALVVTMMGLALKSYAKKHGLEITNPLHYIYTVLTPDFFKPFVLVGLVAVILSSADSWLHSAGNLLFFDSSSPGSQKITLRKLKLGVLGLGLGCVLIALKGELLIYNLRYVLSLVSPILCAPMLAALLGARCSSKTFFTAAGFAVTTFFAITFFIPCLENLTLALSTMVSGLVFLITHLRLGQAPSTFSPKSPIDFHKNIAFKKLRNIFVAESYDEKKPYTIFGFCGLFIIFISYIAWESIESSYEMISLYTRALGAVLCSLLISHTIWPRVFRRYLFLFWHFTLLYCLSFLPVLFLMLTHLSSEYVNYSSISILFLFLLTDSITTVMISLIGGVLALITYNLLVPSNQLPNENFVKLIPYMGISYVVGYVLSFFQNARMAKYKSKSRLLELIQANTISSTQKAMTLHSREASQINPDIANLSMKEKLDGIINKYGESKELQADLLQLSSLLETEEYTKIYYVLNAKRYNTSDLAQRCEEAMQAAGCDHVSMEIKTQKRQIRCDEATLLKTLYKVSNDFCKKVYNENSGDDTYLNLALYDAKILYESDEENGSEKLFSREIDCICLLVTEGEMDSTRGLVKTHYRKKLTDLEAISPADTEDISLLDIEKGIDAHYGILENHSSKHYFTWTCIIPADVYEIRPETLDLSEPLSFKYNWPAAVELEKEFIDQLKKNYSDINIHKIDYALSVIKKYHYHQMRKSGEPYYMHPINVAKLLLTTISEEKTEIHKQLVDDKESLLLAALLHDVLEDTSYSKAALTRNFGTKVRDIVLSVTKINYSRRAVLLSNKQAFQDLVDKEPLSLCVKLVDRLHNLMTLDGHPSVEKRKKVAQETLDFFVKPAERYGLEKLAKKLRESAQCVLQHGKVEGYQF